MSTSVCNPAASLRVFLERSIDYAGLFPPASLDMRRGVSNYSLYLDSPERWALGRFVLPVARLDEFLNAQENLAASPWQLSGVISANIKAELAAVDEFNRKAPGAVIDAVEVQVRGSGEIDLVRANQPPRTTVFFEFAPEQAAELLPILKGFGGYAKLRTGGVAAEAFPTLGQVAAFLANCAESGVPFKATAGLHHVLRSFRPLTYQPDSRQTMMHGFLNLLTAAAIAWTTVRSGKPAALAALATCLADRERANWHFGEDAMTWSGEAKPVRIDAATLRSMRSEFALSFGSCSFDEPLQELREFELL
jgi:hypothetical protein